MLLLPADKLEPQPQHLRDGLHLPAHLPAQGHQIVVTQWQRPVLPQGSRVGEVAHQPHQPAAALLHQRRQGVQSRVLLPALHGRQAGQGAGDVPQRHPQLGPRLGEDLPQGFQLLSLLLRPGAAVQPLLLLLRQFHRLRFAIFCGIRR